MVKVAN